MFGFDTGPTPPTWKILIYCAAALLIICALGWVNTHLLGDKTHYDTLRDMPSSSVSETAPETAK